MPWTALRKGNFHVTCVVGRSQASLPLAYGSSLANQRGVLEELFSNTRTAVFVSMASIPAFSQANCWSSPQTLVFLNLCFRFKDRPLAHLWT